MCGRDFFLAYSPEREDPGRREPRPRPSPSSWAASTRSSTDVAMVLYEQRHRARCTASPPRRSPKPSKLLENIYRAVNIAMVNEMKVRPHRDGHRRVGGHRSGVDEALRLPAFYPGTGARRSLHSDRPVLSHLEGEGDRPQHPIHRAGRARSTPTCAAYVVSRVSLALNEDRQAAAGQQDPGDRHRLQAERRRHSGEPRRGDHRAPAGARGGRCRTTIRTCPTSRRCATSTSSSSSIPLTKAAIGEQDCVLIVTDHDGRGLRAPRPARARSSSTAATRWPGSRIRRRRS